MSSGSRWFAGLIFFAIGIVFIAQTSVLFWEFGAEDGFTLAAFYSHLFLFFPIFGIVTLFAFFTPAAIFVDLYRFHVPYGRLRFAIGTVVVLGVAFMIANVFRGGAERSVYEITPAALMADRAQPAGCTGAKEPCRRMPVMSVVRNIQEVSQTRLGLEQFRRNCAKDPLVELVQPGAARRFCFITNDPNANPATLADDDTCCRAQRHLVGEVRGIHSVEGNASLTGLVHDKVLWVYTFFLLVLVVISALLAIRRRRIDLHYPDLIPRLERGLLIGVVMMLFWPIMNHAYLQSAEMMYGGGGASNYRQVAPFYSFFFGVWALMLLFFFFRRVDKDVEAVGKIAGVVASFIAMLKYDLIVDVATRLAGSGASHTSIAGLAAVAAIALLALYRGLGPGESMLAKPEAADTAPADKAKPGAVPDAAGAAKT